MISTNYFKVHIKEPKSEDRFWLFNGDTIEQKYAEALAGSSGKRLGVYKRPPSERFQYVPEIGENYSPALLRDLCERARATEDHGERYLDGRAFEAKDGQELAALCKVFSSLTRVIAEMGLSTYVRKDEPRMKPAPSAKDKS